MYKEYISAYKEHIGYIDGATPPLTVATARISGQFSKVHDSDTCGTCIHRYICSRPRSSQLLCHAENSPLIPVSETGWCKKHTSK